MFILKGERYKSKKDRLDPRVRGDDNFVSMKNSDILSSTTNGAKPMKKKIILAAVLCLSLQACETLSMGSSSKSPQCRELYRQSLQANMSGVNTAQNFVASEKANTTYREMHCMDDATTPQ
jgi:hypothetical protein